MKIKVLLTFLCCFLLMSSSGRSEQVNTMKSIFIYRIANYIEWPQYFDDSFRIIIYDDHALYRALKRTLQGKIIKGRKVVLEEGSDLKTTKTAHMVIVGNMGKDKWTTIYNLTKDHPVILVSHAKGMLHQGATINFYIHRDRMRFEINDKVIQNTGVKVLPRLLELAQPQEGS